MNKRKHERQKIKKMFWVTPNRFTTRLFHRHDFVMPWTLAVHARIGLFRRRGLSPLRPKIALQSPCCQYDSSPEGSHQLESILVNHWRPLSDCWNESENQPPESQPPESHLPSSGKVHPKFRKNLPDLVVILRGNGRMEQMVAKREEILQFISVANTLIESKETVKSSNFDHWFHAHLIP